MDLKQKIVAWMLLLTIPMGYSIYTTFIAGTTNDPDLIQSIRSGRISADTISSIEVVEPPTGHRPFTAKQYDALPRRRKINSRATIDRFLALLSDFQDGRIHQNHPRLTYQAYIKVHATAGFYWLYCDVYWDDQSAVLLLSANARNATNPNGASVYHLQNFSEVLAILESMGTPPI